MRQSHSPTRLKRPKRQLMRTLIPALLLATLLLTWPTASRGQDAAADSVVVARQLLVDARTEITELERTVAYQDSMLVAQKNYYITLLGLKDQRIAILEETVEDALGSPTRDFFDKLVWGLAGYGVGKLDD